MTELYLMGSGRSRGAYWLKGSVPDDFFAVLRAQAGTPGWRFGRHSGTRFYDFHGCTAAVLYFISEYAASEFQKHSITGWQYLPVQIDLPKAPNFGILQITGRGGPLELSHTKVLAKDYFTEYRGLVLDRRLWDGSDLFLPRDSGFILARPRVREVVKQCKLKNFEFEPVSEITFHRK